MALADQHTISAGQPTVGTGSTLIFSTTKRGPDGTERIDTLSAPGTPNLLVVKHSVQGVEVKGVGEVVDRHLISIIKSNRQADNVLRKLQVNLTVSNPRSANFSSADVRAELWRMFNFLNGTPNIDAIMRGES